MVIVAQRSFVSGFVLSSPAGYRQAHTFDALMHEALFPVASPKLPGVRKRRNAAQIAGLPLVADLSRQGWQDWVRAAGVHGAKIDARYTFSDSTDALHDAAHGLGAASSRPGWRTAA